MGWGVQNDDHPAVYTHYTRKDIGGRWRLRIGQKAKAKIGRSPSADKKAFRIQVDAYPRYAASALAANALVRCSFAGKF